MGTNNFLRSVLFIYLGFPLLELALEKGTFWQLIALKKLQSKILILVNRFTAKITLSKPRNMQNTLTLHALERTLFCRHIACAGVWSNARVRYNPMSQEVCALNANSLLFVLIDSILLYLCGWFAICIMQ